MVRKPDFTLQVIHSRHFFWDVEGGTAEASSITAENICTIDRRIWKDSADRGFWIRSARTGREVLFVLEEEIRVQGALSGLRYISQDDAVKMRVTIFNT